jgi:glycosyltransferase involved in cell wall biosynthesis
VIHLIVRLPVAYQRTLCRTLDGCYNGAFKAWFAERTTEESPCEGETGDRFHRDYLSEVGYGKLFRELRADREAIVILGGWSSPMTTRTLLFTSCLRIPVFIWADHPHPRRRSWIVERVRMLYLRFVSLIVKGFLACGRPTAEHLETLGIHPQRITNFPYWVDVPDAWSLPDRCTSYNGEPLRLLAVGRHVPVKQFEVAIQAMARVNQGGKLHAALMLAGEGPERAKLETLATSLGCKEAVCFAGWLNNTDVFRELERADALVLTSKFDAYGVVVLEAMAQGRAVLASEGVVAARDRCEGDAVFLHPTGDADVLASQIRALADDRELLRRASLSARATAEEWPVEKAAIILKDQLSTTRRGSLLLKNSIAKSTCTPTPLSPTGDSQLTI